MKLLIKLILLISMITNSLGSNCRTGCEVCDPIGNWTCLKCIDGKWGDMCQNPCYCEDACDVNTGTCIIYIEKNTSNTMPHIMVFMTLFIAISVFVYNLYYATRRSKKLVPSSLSSIS